MLLTSKTKVNSRPNLASLLSIAIVVGAVCLSITDAIPGGVDGAWGFVLGSAAAFIVLTIIQLASSRPIEKVSSSKSEEERISEIAVSVSRWLTKGSGKAEWK